MQKSRFEKVNDIFLVIGITFLLVVIGLIAINKVIAAGLGVTIIHAGLLAAIGTVLHDMAIEAEVEKDKE